MCAVCAPLPTRRTERVDPSVAEREEQSQQKTAILAYFSNVWRMFDDVEMRVRARSDLRGESVLGRVVWQRAASPVEMCRRLRRCKQRFYEDW
ncbi:MAG: hypothetical protein DMG72_00380 [Acidobacteria bacterium]|nr:MAG: hypothetical protein DMG72_00380 [Acidobacteriota bacterium]